MGSPKPNDTVTESAKIETKLAKIVDLTTSSPKPTSPRPFSSALLPMEQRVYEKSQENPPMFEEEPREESEQTAVANSEVPAVLHPDSDLLDANDTLWDELGPV